MATEKPLKLGHDAYMPLLTYLALRRLKPFGLDYTEDRNEPKSKFT